MIVRREGRGYLLISQPAHAWLAGELAAAWGNERFARPSPPEAVVMATRLHDIGWLAWDGAPRLGEDGRPVNFLDTTLSETIPLWKRAVEQVSLLDPYAALLVSKHASTIYRRRLQRGADPPEQRAAVAAQLADHAAIQAAMSRQLASHRVYGPAVEPNRLNATYRWLRACDLLSLALCTDDIPAAGMIDAVVGIEPVKQVQVRYERPQPFELRLDPTPFAGPLELEIQTRRLTESTYPSQAAYLAAVEQAPWTPRRIIVSGI
ncbi:MAG: DUF3891 family protein [Chloroflexota bacterium]|nr:MAG: DUF3891 family protein [Chloroflexota bacterium]